MLAKTSQRKARNLIHGVMDAKGIWHTEFPDLAKEVLNYYMI